MKRNEIFNKVNEVISIIDNIFDEELQNYILSEINSNNYCCEENYREYIGEEFEDEEE